MVIIMYMFDNIFFSMKQRKTSVSDHVSICLLFECISFSAFSVTTTSDISFDFINRFSCFLSLFKASSYEYLVKSTNILSPIIKSNQPSMLL